MLQDLFTGITVGLLYGAVGVGFVIIHRIAGMVNFAQGELAMVGGFAAVIAQRELPTVFALPAGAVCGGVVGLILYVAVIHPLRNKGLLVQTIATLGAAIVIRSAVQLKYGTSTYDVDPLTDGTFRLAGASISRQAVWLLLFSVLAFFALKYFFERTMIGRAMSACAVNRYAAGIVGINVTTMGAIAFVLSGTVVGFIAAVAAPLTLVTASSGLTLALKGFIAAILGGFDKIGLALLGGILVGVLEAVSAARISTSYQSVIVLSALLILLIVRPTGLTRNKVSERV
jgi:branched-chain amino acid transport system permease protein